ncbi:polyadenylate binding protein [Pisolithus sp. B1]|nr:polyadenylate binding protein [Pisolithus sp. B1]
MSAPEAASIVQPDAAASPLPPLPSTLGELDLTVSEAMLFEIFNMIGPVASIRVCRDAVTRRSLGYAYVNYLNGADGQRALEQLNYSLIKNRPCRIMWSQRDPALHDTFAAFGNVLSCKVATDEQGRSKGYGFVHYETAEAAESAIKAVNGMLLNDKKVYVGHHISRKERQSKMEEMRAQFTNEEFEALFQQFGNVTSAIIQFDEYGNSKGFGFVNFESHEGAQRAVESLHDLELHGKNLYVARAQKKAEREEELRRSYEQAKMERLSKYAGVNLYIKNLEDDIDDDKLRAEFEPFGTITSCKVMRDEKGMSRGFGFVCFSSPDEATKAVADMNNKMIGSKPLYVSLAQRREIRRQQLESQIAQRNQIRMQQAAAAGRNMMGYGQPSMMPPRPRYPPGGGQVPGMGMPYGAPPPQYGMPGYSRPPRPPVARGPGSSPTNPTAPIPRSNVPSNNASRPGPPPGGAAGARPPPAGAPAPGMRNQQPYKLNPQTRNAPSSVPPVAPQPEVPTLTAVTLANASPLEQKQMLGEVIYMRIVSSHPDLAGKITGMLLEMDNSELLHLLDSSEAMDGKVAEALNVLNDFAKGQDVGGVAV